MSGGIDSSACAHHLQRQGVSIQGLFVDYGQAAAAREVRAVSQMAAHLGVTVQQVAVAGLPTSGAGELVGRNVFLIFTALFLSGGRSGLLALGLHAGVPYYDCSQAFFGAAAKLVAEHTDGRTLLVAPFLDWSKKDVFDYFTSAGLPIGATYSCETGGERPCGHCASCRDREALGC